MDTPIADSLTELDRAYALMDADEENEGLRLAFFERLADTELFVILEREAVGDVVEPRLFEAEGQDFALVFDRSARVEEFAGEVQFLALSGRALCELLNGQKVGLALNIGCPSQMLLPHDAVEWLRNMLGQTPQETQGQLTAIHPPRSLSEEILANLDRKLATAVGRAKCAYLVDAEYADGASGALLVFVDAVAGSEGALSKAANEVLAFSLVPGAALDVSFARSSDPIVERLRNQGLQFELPQPEEAKPRPAPGSDPAKPPILR